jgi:hypothetical protein
LSNSAVFFINKIEFFKEKRMKKIGRRSYPSGNPNLKTERNVLYQRGDAIVVNWFYKQHSNKLRLATISKVPPLARALRSVVSGQAGRGCIFSPQRFNHRLDQLSLQLRMISDAIIQQFDLSYERYFARQWMLSRSGILAISTSTK